MTFLDQVCHAQPQAFFAAAVLVLALLNAALIAVIARPASRGRLIDHDVMAEPHGDQPQVPS